MFQRFCRRIVLTAIVKAIIKAVELTFLLNSFIRITNFTNYQLPNSLLYHSILLMMRSITLRSGNLCEAPVWSRNLRSESRRNIENRRFSTQYGCRHLQHWADFLHDTPSPPPPIAGGGLHLRFDRDKVPLPPVWAADSKGDSRHTNATHVSCLWSKWSVCWGWAAGWRSRRCSSPDSWSSPSRPPPPTRSPSPGSDSQLDGEETRRHTCATISDKRRSSSSSGDGGGLLAVWEVPSGNDHVTAGCHGSKWFRTHAEANWKKWNSVWIWRMGSQSVGWGPYRGPKLRSEDVTKNIDK